MILNLCSRTMASPPILLLFTVYLCHFASVQAFSLGTSKHIYLGCDINGEYLDTFPDFSSDLKIEPFLGAVTSLAYGDFIDYQKTFHDAAETGTIFENSIQPVFMVTTGIQSRYTPFSNGILNNLNFSLGIQYVQKGFVNQFKMTYSPESAYTDITEYKEIYRHNYLTIPVQIRWGQKWFATMGLTFNQHLNSIKTQKLIRSQTGSGAINGGFESKTTDKKSIEEKAINKSHSNYTIGGGYQLGLFAVAARINIGGELLKEAPINYKAVLIELSIFKSFQLFN